MLSKIEKGGKHREERELKMMGVKQIESRVKKQLTHV